ncbi:hypothetical protein MAPG_06142 [Magnaporthiopsis poae ATCC 64411]|uniref:Uncharacterized protein n=1 Tax=Magnaporthiopsis poae (strain ATCC 64411 / 73-15) TaxID=644358 RepID=A0A0C4E188_MAGP6|nr:hypothetical protein MAPG_06142 [Magnaporthiopsis poae ATCC 64411]
MVTAPGAPNASRPRRNEPATSGAATSDLDEKIGKAIDDLVSFIRAQKTASISKQELTAADGGSTASVNPAGADSGLPDIVMDSATVSDSADGSIGSLPSSASAAEMPSVASDIQSVRRLWDLNMVKQEGRLGVFRDVFLPIFPFVHLDRDLSAPELFKEKPFLWLVIVALTEQSVATQFSMEETIWSIISRIIVAEKLADLDLLLELIAFTN